MKTGLCLEHPLLPTLPEKSQTTHFLRAATAPCTWCWTEREDRLGLYYKLSLCHQCRKSNKKHRNKNSTEGENILKSHTFKENCPRCIIWIVRRNRVHILHILKTDKVANTWHKSIKHGTCFFNHHQLFNFKNSMLLKSNVNQLYLWIRW